MDEIALLIFMGVIIFIAIIAAIIAVIASVSGASAAIADGEHSDEEIL